MSPVVPDVQPWQRQFLDAVLTVFFCQFSDSCAVTTKAMDPPKVTAGTGEECDNNRVPVGVWGYFLFDGLSFN